MRNKVNNVSIYFKKILKMLFYIFKVFIQSFIVFIVYFVYIDITNWFSITYEETIYCLHCLLLFIVKIFYFLMIIGWFPVSYIDSLS